MQFEIVKMYMCDMYQYLAPPCIKSNHDHKNSVEVCKYSTVCLTADYTSAGDLIQELQQVIVKWMCPTRTLGNHQGVSQSQEVTHQCEA